MEPFSAEVLKVLKVYLSFCLFSSQKNIYSCDHIRAQKLLKLLFSCSTKSCHVDKKWTENVLQCYGGFIKVICIKGVFIIIILYLKLCTIKNRLIKWFQTNFVLIFIFKVSIFEFSSSYSKVIQLHSIVIIFC